MARNEEGWTSGPPLAVLTRTKNGYTTGSNGAVPDANKRERAENTTNSPPLSNTPVGSAPRRFLTESRALGGKPGCGVDAETGWLHELLGRQGVWTPVGLQTPGWGDPGLCKSMRSLVGLPGFEPGTSCTPTTRSASLGFMDSGVF